MRTDVIQVDSTSFIILPRSSQIISLRLDESTVRQYDKLAVYISKLNNQSITRSKLMRIVLESVLKRPELLNEILGVSNAREVVMQNNIRALRILSSVLKLLREMINDTEFYELKPHTQERLNYIYRQLNELYDIITLAD
jgi:hypothetical protein